GIDPHQVGMAEHPELAALPLETGDGLPVDEPVRPQELDRDRPGMTLVPGEIDGSHAAFAELLLDEHAAAFAEALADEGIQLAVLAHGAEDCIDWGPGRR